MMARLLAEIRINQAKMEVNLREMKEDILKEECWPKWKPTKKICMPR
jgi:hypothetical protein